MAARSPLRVKAAPLIVRSHISLEPLQAVHPPHVAFDGGLAGDSFSALA